MAVRWKITIQEEPSAPVPFAGDLLTADAAAAGTRIDLPVFIHIMHQRGIVPGHQRFLGKMVFGIAEVLIDIDSLFFGLQSALQRMHRPFCGGAVFRKYRFRQSA